MPITLDTFRRFAAMQGLGDNKCVFASGADKSALSTKSDAGSRPIDARDVKLAQAQDNVYVRSQLLSAVRDALGGEGDELFTRLRTLLLGVTADHPGVDAEFASKPLTMREVRIAIYRLLPKQFDAKIDEAFKSPGVTAGNRELFRSVLTKVLFAERNADRFVSLETLTGEGSVFKFLADLAKNTSSGEALRLAIMAQSLPLEKVLPFLKACSAFGSMAGTFSLDARLHAAMDTIAALPAKKFMPCNLFKIAYPSCKWPSEIPRDVKRIATGEQRTALRSAIDYASMFSSRSACEIAVASGTLGHGMTPEDAKRVLEDPTAFKAEMLPPASLFSGDISAAKGVDGAFSQMMNDLVRDNAMVEIRSKNDTTWTAPPATTLKDHPMHGHAAGELREKLESLFGPNATDVQKSNVMLFMSQNAHMLDSAFSGPLGLGDGKSARGVKYVVNAEPDGSVVVSRSSCFERNRFMVEVGMRFLPDGSQSVVTPPKVSIRKDVSVDEVMQQRTAQVDNLNANANREFLDFVQTYCGKTLVSFFEKEIADMQKEHAGANLTKEDFETLVGDVFCNYLSNPANANVKKELMAMKTGELFAAKLDGLKTVLLNRVNARVAWHALGVQAERDAEAQLRANVGEFANGRKIDVDLLHARIVRCEKDSQNAEMSEDEVKARIDALRDAFVDERLKVFDAVRTHAAGVGPVFCKALLIDAMGRSRRTHDDVMFMVDTANRLPAVVTAANMDRRDPMTAIAKYLAERFIARDGLRHDGEEWNGIVSDFEMYLLLQCHDGTKGAFKDEVVRISPDHLFQLRLSSVGYHGFSLSSVSPNLLDEMRSSLQAQLDAVRQ